MFHFITDYCNWWSKRASIKLHNALMVQKVRGPSHEYTQTHTHDYHNHIHPTNTLLSTRRMPEWAGRQMEAISHRGSRERDYGKHDRFGRSPRHGSSTRRRGNSRDPSEVGKVGQRAARAVEVRKFDRVHAYIPPPPLLIDPRAYPYQPRPHLPWEEEAWGRAPGSDWDARSRVNFIYNFTQTRSRNGLTVFLHINLFWDLHTCRHMSLL